MLVSSDDISKADEQLLWPVYVKKTHKELSSTVDN